MGFKIFMFLIVLLIPAIMIGFGAYFQKMGPKNINRIFGYRTARSMKSQETWTFAHRYIGRIWFFLGWILLALSILSMLLLAQKDRDLVGNIGTIVLYVQLTVLILPLIPTEWALHRRFDAKGVPLPSKEEKK